MVQELLKRGRKNAVYWQVLCNALGMDNRRQLWAQIARERAAGAIILPDNQGGYHLPDESETGDIEAWRRRMMALSQNTLKAAQAGSRATERGV